MLAGAAALMGHLEKAIWSNNEYSKKNPEAILVNSIGILIILFISGVTFLVSKFSKEDPKASVHWSKCNPTRYNHESWIYKNKLSIFFLTSPDWFLGQSNPDTCSQKQNQLYWICPGMGPIKNRPHIGAVSGTIFHQITSGGFFFGFMSRNWVKNTCKCLKKV